MSLNDILKSIKAEAEEEARKIKDESKIEIDKLKKQLGELTKKDQEKLLADFRIAMEKKVKQIKFQKESAKKTALLKKKRELLDKVYDKVIEKITNNDKTYEQVIKKVVNELPQIKDAEIMLAKENTEKTKKALKSAGVKLKIAKDTKEAKAGFVLKSETLEIDNTIETLVEQARGETEIEVSRILFE